MPKRHFCFTGPKYETIHLQTYEDMQQYFTERPHSLAVFDFYDNSYGISKMQSARLNSKIETAEVEIDHVKIDVVSSAELADYFKIESVPTLITFVESESVERIDGSVDDDELDELIQDLVERVEEE